MTYYDEIAPSYNELHGEEQRAKLHIIKQHLKNPGAMLDVGCGTGLSAELHDNIIGVDPSQELLNQAPFKTICAPAEQLPFDDQSFDTVISITAIHNFSDIQKGLQEIERVGKHQYVLSILKKSPKLKEIKLTIQSVMTIEKEIDQGTDIIFFCVKSPKAL